MNSIVNATPFSYARGIQDVSGKTLAPVALAQPTFCPKVYTYAQKGKVGRSYMVVGDARTSIFGAATFDPQSKFANHATIFANAVNAQGCAAMHERILPADAPPPAALRVWLDLLPTQVQDYQRNSDGSIKTDSAGAPVLAGKLQGFLGKWVVEGIAPDADGVRPIGLATQKTGNQTDATAGTQSIRYPWMDVEISSHGSWGNDQGLRMWAPTTLSGTPIDSRLVADQKAYQFFIAVAARPDALTTPKVVSTVSGGQAVPFVLKPGLIDRNTGSQMYLGDVFVKNYSDHTPGITPTIGAFDNIHIYDAAIGEVLEMLYQAEFAHADAFSDFTGEEDEKYRFNPFSATSSTGVAYHTFQIVTGASDSARLTENSTLFAQGGGDGTMSNALFAGLVKNKLLEYGDANSPLMDSVMNPETIFWDSGFPMDTKKAMAAVISIRKDIAVAASVFEVGAPALSDDQERSVAISLLTHFQMYPESDYYGTPATRAIIVGSSGYVLNSPWTSPLPASYELLNKAADYMGASNGKWKAGRAFDVAPRNQVDYMRDLTLPFRPANARYKDWDAGLIWPQSYSMTRQFFPQMQTIYPDDTSVLNNFITVMACVWLERIGEAVHRDFTGRSDLTQDQMVDRINQAILDKTKDVFDNRFVIVPETTYTADDKLRGYSWTTVIKIYSPMMQTVQTLTIQANRLDDLAAAA